MNIFKIATIILVIFLVISSGAFFVASSNLSNTEGELHSSMDESRNLRSEIYGLEGRVAIIENNLDIVKGSLEENLSELVSLRSGNRYGMHDPTYLEVKQFLANDKTDTIPYDEPIYMCGHYAREVNNYAEALGIRCAFVDLYLNGNISHMIVAFNTTDRGLVYFEPQSDEEAKPEIGKHYWSECVVCKSGYYYEEWPDDIIEDILFYW